ncbi:MAG: type II secretion system protein [Elusimicrobiaceae bacterium]|nr:type II secretion system protein [Elusimicrobiaceae bacterium]
MDYRNNKKGFTLMELLVTIILVAILASYAVYYYSDIMRESEVNAAKGRLAALGGATTRYVLERGTFSLTNADGEIAITDSIVAPGVCIPISSETSDADKASNVFRCGYAERSLGFDEHFDFYFSTANTPCAGGATLNSLTVVMKPKAGETSAAYPACAYFDPNQDKVVE